MSESSSDENVATNLSAKECDQLCKHFSEVTGGNAIEAMMFLQNSGWVLDRAINAYYGGEGASNSTSVFAVPESGGPTLKRPATEPKVDESSDDDVVVLKKSKQGLSGIPSSSRSDPHDLSVNAARTDDPRRITVLSWNIDGLDESQIRPRTAGAIAEMKKVNPDVIFLQEVVPMTWKMVMESFPSNDYVQFPADDQGYFTAMLLKKATIWCDKKTTKPFPSSLMSRKLQIAEVNIKGIDFKLLTSHLESTKDHAPERRKQLLEALEIIGSTPDDINVLFGGDLNLREKDLQGINFPPKAVDFWETLGKRKEAQYTWDTQKNDNLTMNSKFKPRCRFDRMYFRPSKDCKVKPLYFELAGIERLNNCKRFASDHWGILCHLAVKLK